MAGLSFIIGIIGNLISILVFLSPVITFKRVVKKKSTESFKGLPYVCTLLSTSLWTFYGLLKPDGLLVVTVNGAGALLQASYVTIFLIYAPKETKVKYLKLVGALNIGFYAAVVLIVLLAIHGSIRLAVVGSLCAGLTLGMYASPLVAMVLNVTLVFVTHANNAWFAIFTIYLKLYTYRCFSFSSIFEIIIDGCLLEKTVITTKSVEYMPFSLSFFLFLNGGIWSVYALLVKDFYIGVPNAIGFVLGSTQLVVYMVYRRRSIKSAEKVEEDKEAGSAHLVEMGKYAANDTKERSLSKGRSLPKTSVSRQHSFQKIMKTQSLSAHESHSNLRLEEDVENGDEDKHNH